MTPGISEHTPALPQATGSWAAHTWRLALWTLFLARRRLMSKILTAILLAGFLLVVAILLLSFLAVRSVSQSTTTEPCPPTPVITSTPIGPSPGENLPPCVNLPPGQPEQRTPEQEFASSLTFPSSLGIAGDYTTTMGVILLCILAGALVGNEYSFGTQRLALSRGVSRAQLLAAQVGAFAILALIVAGGMLVLGALFGITIGPAVGGTIPGIPASGWGQMLLYWLTLAFNLLAYTLIALFLGTLGRSTAVGIAGSLGYIILEYIALPILALVAEGVGGSTGSTLTVIHHVFLGPNLSALLAGVSTSPLDLGGSSANNQGLNPIPSTQGLLVALLYCVALIGLSYWMLRQRDVTS